MFGKDSNYSKLQKIIVRFSILIPSVKIKYQPTCLYAYVFPRFVEKQIQTREPTPMSPRKRGKAGRENARGYAIFCYWLHSPFTFCGCIVLILQRCRTYASPTFQIFWRFNYCICNCPKIKKNNYTYGSIIRFHKRKLQCTLDEKYTIQSSFVILCI